MPRRVAARLASPSLLLRKCDSFDALMSRHRLVYGCILNVGSKSVRLPGECTNTDIVPGPDVDVVVDAHELAARFPAASFDTVVLAAMLQYCRDPHRVVQQASTVLKPGGALLIDAPFLQPYCPDGKDLWRFTDDGLRELCGEDLEVLEVSIAIGAGSALAFVSQAAASERRSPMGAGFARLAAASLLWPLRYALQSPRACAGAFLLLARRRA